MKKKGSRKERRTKTGARERQFDNKWHLVEANEVESGKVLPRLPWKIN